MSDAARSPAGAHNLPRPLTPLVGCDRELAEVAGLLADRRLVTLSGPGGCGKARLAVAVAGEVSAAFEGGVWWVELTAVSEPAGVARAVATVFGVRERPGRPLLDTW
jgi:predicted ATPase